MKCGRSGPTADRRAARRGARPVAFPACCLTVWLALSLSIAPLHAQRESAQEDSATVVAGPEYDAGWLHRALLGDGYRDSWTAPIRVPILNLDIHGGLTPVERGGGVQTSTLRFEAPDGREYNFRSVNKSYDHSMPEWARGTIIQWLRKDQTAAQHPGAAIAATPLLEAAGVLNPGPRLFVMADDPRLGEFREEFAGLLGTLELHPNEGDDDEPLSFGAPKIAAGDRVLEHLAEEPEHRLDAPAFLAERLLSIYLGDWDRHIGQYRFARYERDGIYRWVPIPEDRDYAFVQHDGLLMAVARSALAARLIRFKDEYPDLTAMMSNSPDLVRRLLSPLDRPAWNSVAATVHASLNDAAIDRAIAALPPEWESLNGADLAATLRARRDRFPAMSDRMYNLLAEEAEVHGTDERERALIEHHRSGAVTVRLYAPANERLAGRPYYERRFVPAETREVRLFLYEGDDHAVIRYEDGDEHTGSAEPEIRLRVVGGEGDDVLVDSVGGAVLYDAEGDNRFVRGSGTRVDTRPFVPPEEEPSPLPNKPRDWGETSNWFTPAIGWVSDAGLLVGGGPVWTHYGFRHVPFESRQRLTAMVLTESLRGRLAYTGSFRPETSPLRIEVLGRLSNVEMLRFHGFGNETPDLPDDSALSWIRRYEADAALVIPLASGTELGLGATVLYSDPELEDGTRLDAVRPFGVSGLGEVGARAGVRHDTRDDEAFPRRGMLSRVDLGGYVPLVSEARPYGRGSAVVSAYLPLPVPASPILALRVGGAATTGDTPVYRSAFIGGRSSLRGFSQGRFAGDAAAYGTAEVRVPLAEAEIIARGTLGVSAFGDAGRVWVDGSSTGDWHTAVGGAAWFTTPVGTVAVELASGERRGLYLRLGMGL